MDLQNSLDECWIEWIRVALELKSNGISCCAPFFSSKPAEFERNKKILLVGKATAGWYWNTPNNSPFGFSNEELSVRQQQANADVRDGVTGHSGFRTFMLRVASALGDDSPNPKNLIWSNLFKIGGEDGNPGRRLAARQEHLAVQTLRLEIDEYRPDVVIFTTIGYFEDIVRKVVGIDREPDWIPDSEGNPDETWALTNIGGPQFLWTRHPAFKSAKTIDRLIERAVSL